jgi:hypothetical protein
MHNDRDELVEKTKLAHALGERIARTGSWTKAADVLGLDNIELARLLVYRFRGTPPSELKRLAERLAA